MNDYDYEDWLCLTAIAMETNAFYEKLDWADDWEEYIRSSFTTKEGEVCDDC
mgnify:FL=1